MPSEQVAPVNLNSEEQNPTLVVAGSASHEIPDHLWDTKIVFTKIPALKRKNQDGELRFPEITLRH